MIFKGDKTYKKKSAAFRRALFFVASLRKRGSPLSSARARLKNQTRKTNQS